MRKVRAVIFGAIVGGYAVLAGLGGAEAAFVAGGIAPLPGTADDTPLIRKADHPHYHFRKKHSHSDRKLRHRHRYDRRRHGGRYRHRRPGFSFYFGGYWYSMPWWNYSVPRRYCGNRHVEWCLGRYRSYNPNTDRYLGYDGHYHRCRSPYR